MKEIQKVAIIGMGALGIMYGQRISETLDSNHLVFIGNQKRIDKLDEEAVFCNDHKCQFRMIDPSKTNFKADLVIFAVKATALQESIELAKNIVTEDTIILSVLNGISSEEIIDETLNKGMVIKSVAQGMDALKINNKLSYQNFGVICTGLTSAETHKQSALDRLIQFFNHVKIPFVLEEDINKRLWGKWMLNVGVNQVVMIYEGTFKTIQKDGEARNMMIAAMNEVLLLAHKLNIDLNQNDLQFYVDLMSTLNPDGMPSMRQDGLAKRQSEVELFAGTVIKKANELGINVPINEMLYTRVKEIESAY